MGLFKKKENISEDEQKKLKIKELNKLKAKINKNWTFTKFAIIFILINSELQIWASYGLAYLGKDAIAEALSQQIVITIVGTVIGYFVKSTIENLSKYTTMFGKNLEFMENQEKQDCNNNDNNDNNDCDSYNSFGGDNGDFSMPNTMDFDNPDNPISFSQNESVDTIIPDETDYSSDSGLSYEARTMCDGYTAM